MPGGHGGLHFRVNHRPERDAAGTVGFSNTSGKVTCSMPVEEWRRLRQPEKLTVTMAACAPKERKAD